ncbi:MAG: MFS transporter [Syntrophomonadaceae bacterium]|jgi:DHA3 family macrolide efflux protein-like MFS transporter|nr:MFS transporter [Syntrophomonadaceae bacterium]
MTESTTTLTEDRDWKKNTALFLTGQGLSFFGSMLVSYAIMWHVTLQTQSGSVMTLFTIAAVLPMFFISPFGGVWADRYNRKLLINISDSAIALVTLFMAVLLLSGIEHIALLFICATVRGFGQGVQMPAVNALIPQIVPQNNLTKINGINNSIQSLCTLASPMLAGAILSVAPIEIILFVDVVTASIGVGILFFLVKVPDHTKSEKTNSAPSNYLQEMKEGLNYIQQRPFIKRLMIFMAVFSVMMAPGALLTPLQVTRDFGMEIWRLTALEIVFSAGMMLGGIVIGVWGGFKNRIYSMSAATVFFGIEAIGLGLLENFWLYLGCMSMVGLTVPLFNTPMMSIFQSKVDVDYMGRVFGVMSMISSVMMPLGMLVFGPLSDLVAIDWLLIGTGAVTFLMGPLLIGNRSLREAGQT